VVVSRGNTHPLPLFSLLFSPHFVADLIVTQTEAPPPLPEQAEMHLLEAIGLMTSARSYPVEGAAAVNNEAHLQLSLLREILGSLVDQLLSLTDSRRISRYGEQMAEIVAWKFGSLGALTKGHSPKSHNGDVANLFNSALNSILPTICEFAKFKQSRSKGIIFLHRMVQCISDRVLEPCSKCIGVFLEYSEPNDVEHPIQLLNQLMAEFGSTPHVSSVVEIVDPVLLPVVDRLSAIYSDLQQLSASSDQILSANAVTSETTLEAEKLNILKQYLMFLQHVATFHIHPALVSPRNLHRLPDLLNNVISGIQGGENDGIRVSMGLILRRSSLMCLTSLVSAWLSPSSSSSSSPEVHELLSNVLCNEALPTAFRSFTSGALNLGDAQVQGYVGEVSNLIWTMSAVVSPQETHGYIQTILLPSLQWPPVAINEMARLLDGKDLGQLNTFREAFKKLIRKLCR
jgi:hypothetical protein